MSIICPPTSSAVRGLHFKVPDITPVTEVRLDFTLSIHHDLSQYSRDTLKKIVTVCFGQIVGWSELRSRSCPSPKLKYREPIMKIICTTRPVVERKIHLYEVYRRCISEWFKKLILYTKSKDCPSLAIHKNAFLKTPVPSHEGIFTHEMCFGTMMSNTEFYEHCAIAHIQREREIAANFFHDTKYAELCFGKNTVIILYSSINRIIYDEGEHLCEVYLCLINPTIHYVSQDKSQVRVASIPDVSLDVVGRSNTLKLTLAKSVTTSDIVSRLYFRCGQIQVFYNVVLKNLARSLPPAPNVDLQLFKCTYMLNSLLLRSYKIQIENPGAEMDLLVQWLANMARNNQDLLYAALIDVMHMTDDGVFFNFRKAVQDLFLWHSEEEENLGLSKIAHFIEPPNSRYVWRITLTPTRKLLWPASIMLENRILRNFDSGHAFRVVFRDDNNRKLCVDTDRKDDSIYDLTVRKPMTEGIRIGPRHLRFLGWSNSQIRDHGVWMYAEDGNGNTVEDLRKWMGDFSQISSVPMYMSRMGQCFSQSKESINVPLNGNRILTEPDIVGGCNPLNSQPYIFSDGVGRISSSLHRKVCQSMDLENLPSALQIRYAGYKGMLVLDPTLSEVDIVFRKSMKKFECTVSQNLEIVKTSQTVPVFLNRNLVAILSHLGIKPGIFLKLQEDNLKNLTDFLLETKLAVETLKTQCPLHDLEYGSLSEVGICPTSESFFRCMLVGLHKKGVDNIKNKARLGIPYNNGRNMFGVMDETGTLDYGQVFVQYSTELDKKPDKQVLTGPVMVTKNPCLHEGDVRMFEAVDVPDLHHIVDCIVFPQRGSRPHPNEMAGSDLDGDEYTVIWHKALLFENNAEPEHFQSMSSQQSDQPFTMEDTVEFLCSYVRNDQIGLIGNAHLAQAEELGLNHPICRSIAKKFSVAVDFVKNGLLVTLDKDERPSRYPDYMAKEYHSDTYRSHSVLGKLFRICQNFDTEELSLSYRNVKVDNELVLYGWQHYQQEAIQLRDRYNHLLESLLATYGVNHEPEAMSQALLSIHSRLQERRDKSEVEEIIRRSIRALWMNMKTEFMREFWYLESTDADLHFLKNVSHNMLLKASAWYVVTYSDPDAKFLSFPWIVSKQLALIKAVNRSAKGVPPPLLNLAIHKLNVLLMTSMDFNQIEELVPSVKQLCAQICPHLCWSSLKLALRILLHWARHQGVIHEQSSEAADEIGNVGLSWEIGRKSKTVEISGLIYSFLNVIKDIDPRSSAIEMQLRFLRKCISLRFLETSQVGDPLYRENLKFRAIGKKAMLTYHSIAIKGDLGALGLRTFYEKNSEVQEMEPVRLPAEIVSRYKWNDFERLKSDLAKRSGASEIRVRYLTSSVVLLSACGTLRALRKLKAIIAKDQYI